MNELNEYEISRKEAMWGKYEKGSRTFISQ